MVFERNKLRQLLEREANQATSNEGDEDSKNNNNEDDEVVTATRRRRLIKKRSLVEDKASEEEASVKESEEAKPQIGRRLRRGAATQSNKGSASKVLKDERQDGEDAAINKRSGKS